VASGIGQLTLVDDDIVEQTNLQRQILHGESDIGQTKCLSAQQSLQRLNSDTNIDVIQHRLDDEQLYAVLQEHDIIIDCSDNLATRNQLNQAAFKVHRPLVSGAAIRMEGQICSFLFCANNPCYQCLSSSFLEQDLSCVEAGVMSPIVGIVGSMQALETIKILTDYGQPLTNQLMLFDGLSMQWQKFKISKNAQCSVCGQQNTD
jgi:adenylyltransferase/sulfurtransferase